MMEPSSGVSPEIREVAPEVRKTPELLLSQARRFREAGDLEKAEKAIREAKELLEQELKRKTVSLTSEHFLKGQIHYETAEIAEKKGKASRKHYENAMKELLLAACLERLEFARYAYAIYRETGFPLTRNWRKARKIREEMEMELDRISKDFGELSEQVRKRVLDIPRGIERPLDKSIALANISEVLARSGKTEHALDLANYALDAAKKIEDPFLKSIALANKLSNLTFLAENPNLMNLAYKIAVGLYPPSMDLRTLLTLIKVINLKKSAEEAADLSWKAYLFLVGRGERPPVELSLARTLYCLWKAARAAMKVGGGKEDVYRLLFSFKDVIPFSIKPIEGEEELLIHRDEMDELRAKLLRFSGVIALVGDRGLGKSSLLRKIAKDMREVGWLCITLEVPMPYTPMSFLSLLFKRIAEGVLEMARDPVIAEECKELMETSLSIIEDLTYEKKVEMTRKIKEEIGIPGFEVGPLKIRIPFRRTETESLTQSRKKYRRTLPGLVEELKEYLKLCYPSISKVRREFGILIIIDELDKLLGDPKKSDLLKNQFLNIIRGISNLRGVYVVFSALPEQIPSLKKGEPSSPEYSTIDSIITLKKMEEKKIRELIDLRVRAAGLLDIFDEEVLDEIAKIAGGSPREAIRLLCDCWYKGLVSGEEKITKRILDSVKST